MEDGELLSLYYNQYSGMIYQVYTTSSAVELNIGIVVGEEIQNVIKILGDKYEYDINDSNYTFHLDENYVLKTNANELNKITVSIEQAYR